LGVKLVTLSWKAPLEKVALYWDFTRTCLDTDLIILIMMGRNKGLLLLFYLFWWI
jgi:hypothetical protein